MAIVSLLWPHDVPARARKMLSRALARLAVMVACSEKVKWGSSVTPRIFGFRQRGRGSLASETAGLRWDWWVSEVNRVACDLAIEMERCLLVAHAATSAMRVERALPASRGS